MLSSVKASPWHYFFDGIRKQNLQKYKALSRKRWYTIYVEKS